MGAQELAQEQIGILLDLDAPAGSFFFHSYYLYAHIDKRYDLTPDSTAENSINTTPRVKTGKSAQDQPCYDQLEGSTRTRL